MKKTTKSQGEIFGIALMFVIIIIGIIVYGQIKAINNINNGDIQQEGEYKFLAEGTLNSILKMSTGCPVERNRDSVKDLINFCIENDYGSQYSGPEILCEDGNKIPACHTVKQILNDTLFKLFNSSEGLAKIPFELKIDIPANKHTHFSNKTFTNINNKEELYKNEYKRAPSGLITWATTQRTIEFELYLYYK